MKSRKLTAGIAGALILSAILVVLNYINKIDNTLDPKDSSKQVQEKSAEASELGKEVLIPPPPPPTKIHNALNGPFKPRPVDEASEDVEKTSNIVRLPKLSTALPDTNAQYPPPEKHPYLKMQVDGSVTFLELNANERLSPDLWFLDPKTLLLRQNVQNWLNLSLNQYDKARLAFDVLWEESDALFLRDASVFETADGKQGVMLPKNPLAWKSIKEKFQSSMSEAVGDELAAGIQAITSEQLLALTGDFGNQSQIIYFTTYSRGDELHYVASFETGKSTFIPNWEVLHFKIPQGQTKQSVAESFLQAPDSLVTFQFGELPPPMLRSIVVFSARDGSEK